MHKKEREYALLMALGVGETEGEDDQSNSRELAALKHVLARAVREQLTGRQRDCILLYYGEGLKMREIAARLGIDPAAVTRHIQRGLKQLRSTMQVAAYTLRNFDPGPS